MLLIQEHILVYDAQFTEKSKISEDLPKGYKEVATNAGELMLKHA